MTVLQKEEIASAEAILERDLRNLRPGSQPPVVFDTAYGECKGLQVNGMFGKPVPLSSRGWTPARTRAIAPCCPL